MDRRKIIAIGFVVVISACRLPASTSYETVEFGDILEPHYRPILNELNCEGAKDVSISVFDEPGQTLSFRYDVCASNATGEMVEFSYKSKFGTLEDYVIGKYKIPTPDSAFKINPDADKFTYLDVPILGITKLNEASPQDHLKSKKNFHKSDWSICEVKKWDQHIWGLENPSFKEVPAATYTIDNYESFSEWKLNHEADEVEYREEFDEQKLKNRACANEQHNWYVTKDGILITILNPTNFTGGANPTTITYDDRR